MRPGALGATSAFVFLNDNPITALADGLFDDLQFLMALDLSRTSLEELPPRAFSKNAVLSYLALDGTNVSSLPATTFAGGLRFAHLTNSPRLALDADTFAEVLTGAGSSLGSHCRRGRSADRPRGPEQRDAKATRPANRRRDPSSICAQAVNLEAVWTGGSPNATCDDATLPNRAACVASRCAWLNEPPAWWIDQMFRAESCERSYDGAPTCGEVPCLPRQCFFPE